MQSDKTGETYLKLLIENGVLTDREKYVYLSNQGKLSHEKKTIRKLAEELDLSHQTIFKDIHSAKSKLEKKEQHRRLMIELSQSIDIACLAERCEELSAELAQGKYYRKISGLSLPQNENPFLTETFAELYSEGLVRDRAKRVLDLNGINTVETYFNLSKPSLLGKKYFTSTFFKQLETLLKSYGLDREAKVVTRTSFYK